MSADAIVWTEGKSDAQYLTRAVEVLKFPYRISFQILDEMGDDKLLKQCQALARVTQPNPTIFIFDRDNPEILGKIDDVAKPYKNWGNNVFSFAIPLPDHRPDVIGVSLDLYFTDTELATKDEHGRRLYLSSEFNPTSGRHLTDPSISVAHKGKLYARPGVVRVLDTEVYDESHKNLALSKSDFANSVSTAREDFAKFDFGRFNKILAVISQIMQTDTIDLAFGGMDAAINAISDLQTLEKLAGVLDAEIKVCKFAATLFIALTIRYYERSKEQDHKKFRPISQSIVENFTSPSLSTLARTARQCYHLIDDTAPTLLQDLRSMMAENFLLGPIGEVLDDVERVIPPDTRRGRTVLKGNTKKQLLEYVLPELAKYENRLVEIRNADSEILDGVDEAIWLRAVPLLARLFSPLKAVGFRVGNIIRVDADSDDFMVRLTSYSDGIARTEEIRRKYADLRGDRLETCEANLPEGEEPLWLDMYPFATIKDQTLHCYARTRAIGYELRPVFRPFVDIIPTKRKFSHSALGGTIVADRQMLFWTPVAAAVSAGGVRANIPAHDPQEFVGRKQQIATIIDEVIQIPNENGLLHGPGGVGKTALLIELTRKMFEEGLPAKAPFRSIIWVSAKRDYYDPTLNVVESGSQQFKSLDQIFQSILEFHGFEDAQQYSPNDQRWLILELFAEQKTLLILDNFETISRSAQDEIIRFFGTDVKRYLIDKPDNFKVLLTSREVIPSGFHQIQLKGLDKRETGLLMQRLYQQYSQSGQVQLTDAQRNELYEATKGIPILIKHCYGQIFEYNMPFSVVLQNLVGAGNKVVEFSFAEIFRFLKDDPLQARIIILLELINRSIFARQMADILTTDVSQVEHRLTNLLNFQCIVRSPSDVDERYSINPDIRLLAAKLVHDTTEVTNDIRRSIAMLAVEKRLDYNKDEFDAFVIFQQHLSNGSLAQAEDFIKERLNARPDSILFNLHYAKFTKEQKRQPREAINLLEKIRKSSGNDPQVLRLLMLYHVALEPPEFDQAHIYAMELEKYRLEDNELWLDIAEFYTEWSSTIKMTIELDPIKEMLRQQKYKEHADHALDSLRRVSGERSHRWNYLFAQCHYNKWDYEAAKLSIDRAIVTLPGGSYLKNSYEGLRAEIVKKSMFYKRRG